MTTTRGLRGRLVRLDRRLHADFTPWLGRPMERWPDRALCAYIAHLHPEIDAAALERDDPEALAILERLVRQGRDPA